MDDRTLEREIEALLAAEPSPHFTARVRERIATAPRRDVWPGSAGLAWALTTAAAIVVSVLVLRVDRQPEPGPLRAQTIGIDAYRAPLTVRAARLRERAAVSRRSPAGGLRGSGRAEPEVVIAPAEAAAWRRLLSGAAAGAMTLSFARQTEQATETPAPADLEFAMPPVLIEPLAPAREQGVQQ